MGKFKEMLTVYLTKQEKIDLMENLEKSFLGFSIINEQHTDNGVSRFVFEADDLLETVLLSIIFTPAEHHYQVGIHLKEADLKSLEDAVETALKDGFTKIYVHSLAC